MVRRAKLLMLWGMTLQERIAQQTPSLIAMRRDFHRHPELAFQEFRTSEVLANHLRGLGLEVTTGIATTGVVARLRGGKPGLTVMVRADIDALPIHEATGAEYTSQNPGVMHACGHDGHASIAAHVASVLTGMKDDLEGNVVFVFQPAEEVVGGARPMVEAGVMEGIDRVVGLHLYSQMPTGMVGVRVGPSMAATNSFVLTVHGSGAHAATPHLGVDSVVIAAQIITALQTLVSRETDPIDTAVITIATVYAGEGAHNIIPETAELRGTLRTFNPQTRERMVKRIEELADGVARAMGGRCEIRYLPGTPAVINHPEMTERLRLVAREVLGDDKVLEVPPVMGGDDMSEFLNRAPGVYFWLGASDPSTGKDKPHHHPGFDIDDTGSLPLGVELITRAVLNFLKP